MFSFFKIFSFYKYFASSNILLLFLSPFFFSSEDQIFSSFHSPLFFSSAEQIFSFSKCFPPFPSSFFFSSVDQIFSLSKYLFLFLPVLLLLCWLNIFSLFFICSSLPPQIYIFLEPTGQKKPRFKVNLPSCRELSYTLR